MKTSLASFFGSLLLAVLLNLQTSNSFAAETVKEDTTTPAAAARTFYGAMHAGDTNLFKRISIGTDYQKDWMLGYIRSSLAIRELLKASTAKFGKQPTEKAFGEMVASSEMAAVGLAALTNAEVKIEGTNATITFKHGASDPMMLRRIEGKWKVLLGDDINKADFDKNAVVAMAESQEQCTKDILGDKYKSADEASQALMTALMSKMQGQHHEP